MKIVQGHKKIIVYAVMGVTVLVVLTVSAAAFQGSTRGNETAGKTEDIANSRSTTESTFAAQAQGQSTATAPAQSTATPKPVLGASTRPMSTQNPVAVATPYKNPYVCDENKKAKIEQQLMIDVNAEVARHVAANASIATDYGGDPNSPGYITLIAGEQMNHEHQLRVTDAQYRADLGSIYCYL